MTLESSKNLGGIGAILIVVSPAGFMGGPFGGLLGLVGLILVLIALKGLADHYKEEGIFKNALYGLIVAIVGVAVVIGAAALTALATLSRMGIDMSNLSSWRPMEGMFRNMMNINVLWTLIGGIVAILAVLFVFVVVAVLFFRKSLNILSKKTRENMFATAGLLMLVGAVLTVVLVGLLVIWVAWILVAVGFFSIKT